MELIMIPYLLTGKKGMGKAIWKKFKYVTFGATWKEAKRDMNDYEAAILEIEAENGYDGYKILKKTIGKILLDKYDIETI